MERRVWIAAAVAALAGAGLLRWYTHRVHEEVAGGPAAGVLVVTRDAAAGTALTRDMLARRELPQAYLESRHVRARDLDRVVGAALAIPARASDALLWTDLATLRETARAVSSLVPEGMRAVALARAGSGMEEVLAPGDRVDVLLVAAPDSAGGTAAAVRVAENVLVLAVGGDSGTALRCRSAEPGRRSDTVTVSATPEQSLQLAAAERSGALRLVLRNPEDIAIASGAAQDAVSSAPRAAVSARVLPDPEWRP